MVSSLFLLVGASIPLGCMPLGMDPPDDDDMMMDDALPAATVTRAPFASQCAELAGLCTSSFPQAALSVSAADGQAISLTQDPEGFIVQGTDGDGIEMVSLRGSASAMGNTATELFYSWSYGATDEDVCTRSAGIEFSTEANPEIAMETGIHYIRLTVRNELPLVDVTLDECDDLTQEFKFDYKEVVIEVRD